MSVLSGRGWPPRLAAGALVLSLGVLGFAAREAWRLEPLPYHLSPAPGSPMPTVTPRPAPRSEAAILVAVARDPFRPDRRRPPGRYRMPGEAPPAPPVMQVSSPRVVLVRLLGTVSSPDGGGLAALAGSSGQSRVVRVGQSFEGFRVVRVAPGTATLVGEDTTLVLRAPGGAQ